MSWEWTDSGIVLGVRYVGCDLLCSSKFDALSRLFEWMRQFGVRLVVGNWDLQDSRQMSLPSFGFEGRTFNLGNLRDLDLQVEDYRRKKGGLSIVGSHRLLFLSSIKSIEIFGFL